MTAIKENNFELHYQPKLDFKTGKIIGVEGLVRMKEKQNLVNPVEFIPLAEETGLIIEIDRIVMDIGFNEISILFEELGISLNLALNCSTKALYLKTFPDALFWSLENYLVKPENFELEVTETTIMKNYNESLQMLFHLRNMGIKISLDDFGTGYSSLAQMRNLPINCIKIDRSFICDLEKNRNNAFILELIISLSRKIGITTVAEGIENENQFNFLKEAGCDIAQGYYISKPLPLDELKKFLTLPARG